MYLPAKHPAVSLSICAIVLALLLIGLPKLQISADARVFFSESSSQYQALTAFEQRYGASTKLIIALHSSDGTMFEPKRLRAVRAATDLAWRLPYASRVESIANAVHISSDTETIIVEDTIPVGFEIYPTMIATRVISDILLLNRLIAPDKKTTAIVVTFDYRRESSPVTAQIMNAAKEMIRTLDLKHIGLDVWYGGRVPTSAAFSQSARFDMLILAPLGYAVMLIALATFFQSKRVALSLFSVGLASSFGTLGAAGWAGIELSAATSCVPTIVIAICVASFMHVVVYTINISKISGNKDSAISDSVRTNITPVGITLGTTALGFLTLNSADAPPIRDLGNLVAFGCSQSFLFGFLGLPAILKLIHIQDSCRRRRVGEAIKTLSILVRSNHRRLLIIVPAVLAVPVLMVPRISVDDNFNEYFDARYEHRRHSDAIEQHLTGLDIIEFDLGADSENAIFQREYIENLEQFEEWLRQQPNVVYVSSISEIFKRLNQHANGGSLEFHQVPEDPNMLAQYLLMYELSLPYGQSLNDLVTIDRSRSRVSVILKDAMSSDIVRLKEEGESKVRSFGTEGFSAAGTGLSVMYAYVTSINVKSMIGGSILALVLISTILIAIFGSLKYGFVSLVPNLVPVAVAFGIWGMVVGRVGVAVSVVGVITLGIIVDDTIHMIWRYIEARRSGLEPNECAEFAFYRVGEPMLISTVALLIGFGAVALSGFLVSSAMGALSAITIVVALIADWFLLPPMLIAIDEISGRRMGRIKR